MFRPFIQRRFLAGGLSINKRTFSIDSHIKPKHKSTFKKLLENVTVREIIEEKRKNAIVTIDDKAMTYDAIALMSSEDIGGLVVSQSQSNRPLGIFTERDYIGKLIVEGRHSDSTPVTQVMSQNPIVVTPEFTLQECMAIMASKKIRHLPVVDMMGDAIDQDTRLIGMVSARDMISHLTSCFEKAIDLDRYKSETVEAVWKVLGRRKTTEIACMWDDSVLQALQAMHREKAGGVLVLSQQQLVGIFTERDYLHKVILQHRSSSTTLLHEVMTRDPITVPHNTGIATCLKLMASRQIRTLPVVPLVGFEIDSSTASDAVLGMVTFIDLVSFLHKINNPRLD